MPLHSPFSDRTLREHLRRFPIGEVINARGVSAGVTSVFHLNTTRGRYILRIAENRSETDARFEEALLSHLAAQGLMVPRMVIAGKHGGVVSLSSKQHISIFQHVPGRELGPFEVTSDHTTQVGGFLATIHLAARGLGRRRRNRFDPVNMQRLLEKCRLGAKDSAMLADLDCLNHEIDAQHWSRQLPRGVVHGDMFLENLRFSMGQLCGAMHFETACTSPYVYDLAVALTDWGFFHDRFSSSRAAALIAGYQRVRPLKAIERDVLYPMVRYALARYAVSTMYDFEIRRNVGARRLYKDYRHFIARLDSLELIGPNAFLRTVF